MEHGLLEGRVKGEVGEIDASDIRVEDLDMAMTLAESTNVPCPARTKVLIHRAKTTNMLRHTILRDGWEGAVALIFGKPDVLGPMIGRFQTDPALAELHLIWREAMDLNTRSELFKILNMTTLPPETSVEELHHMFRTALIKGDRSGCHSESTAAVQGVVNRVVELLQAVLDKDWKMVEAKTATITKGAYPIADRVVTQARMLVKANAAGTMLLKRLQEGAEYLSACMSNFTNNLEISLEAEQALTEAVGDAAVLSTQTNLGLTELTDVARHIADMRVATRHGAWSEIGGYRDEILAYMDGNHVEESGDWTLPASVVKEVQWIGVYGENRKVNERLLSALSNSATQAVIDDNGDLTFAEAHVESSELEDAIRFAYSVQSQVGKLMETSVLEVACLLVRLRNYARDDNWGKVRETLRDAQDKAQHQHHLKQTGRGTDMGSTEETTKTDPFAELTTVAGGDAGDPFDLLQDAGPESPSIGAVADRSKQSRRASFFDADHANLFMEVVTHSLVPRHVQDEILNITYASNDHYMTHQIQAALVCGRAHGIAGGNEHTAGAMDYSTIEGSQLKVELALCKQTRSTGQCRSKSVVRLERAAEMVVKLRELLVKREWDAVVDAYNEVADWSYAFEALPDDAHSAAVAEANLIYTEALNQTLVRQLQAALDTGNVVRSAHSQELMLKSVSVTAIDAAIHAAKRVESHLRSTVLQLLQVAEMTRNIRVEVLTGDFENVTAQMAALREMDHIAHHVKGEELETIEAEVEENLACTHLLRCIYPNQSVTAGSAANGGTPGSPRSPRSPKKPLEHGSVVDFLSPKQASPVAMSKSALEREQERRAALDPYSDVALQNLQDAIETIPNLKLQRKPMLALMASAQLIYEMRVFLAGQDVNEVKTLLASSRAKSVSTAAAAAVQSIRDDLHVFEMLPALAEAAPKGAFVFNAAKQTWTELSAVDPAPIQAVVQSVQHIGSNLRSGTGGGAHGSNSTGDNVNAKLKAMVSLAGAVVEMRSAMRKGDFASVAVSAAEVATTGGANGQHHPPEVWGLVGNEITNIECEAARRVAAHDLKSLHGPDMLGHLRSIDLALFNPGYRRNGANGSGGANGSPTRAAGDGVSNRRIKVAPLEPNLVAKLQKLLNGRCWSSEPCTTDLLQLRQRAALVVALRSAVMHEDWNALVHVFAIAVEFQELHGEGHGGGEHTVGSVGLFVTDPWAQLLLHEMSLARAVLGLIETKTMLERCLSKGGGLGGPVTEASCKAISLKPLVEGLKRASTWVSWHLSPEAAALDDHKYRPEVPPPAEEQEAFLASWINRPPRFGGTLHAEALLNEIALRTRCLVVRCDAVLKVRRALKQAAGGEQHVAMELIVKGLLDIESADGELFHAAHKDTGLQFDLNPGLGVEELHGLQDRVGETVSRSAIITDLAAAVDASDETRVLQTLEALELALGGDTIATANGNLGAASPSAASSVWDEPSSPMSRTMQLRTPQSPGARSPRAVRDAAMVLTMSVTSPQAAATRKTPGSKRKPIGTAVTQGRVLTAEQIAIVDRARLYLDACAEARQNLTIAMKSKTPKRIKRSLEEAKSCGLSAQSTPLVGRAQRYLVSVGIDVGGKQLQEESKSSPNASAEILFAGTPVAANGGGSDIPSSPGSPDSSGSPSFAFSCAASNPSSKSAPSMAMAMATPTVRPNSTTNMTPASALPMDDPLVVGASGSYSLPTPPGTFDASTLLAGTPYNEPSASASVSASPAVSEQTPRQHGQERQQRDGRAQAKARVQAQAQLDSGAPLDPGKLAVLKATAAIETSDASAVVDLTMHLNEQKIKENMHLLGLDRIPVLAQGSPRMTWSDIPIKAALTKLSDKRLLVPSKALHKSILAFMGDQKGAAPPCPAAKGMEVLQVAEREPELRIEALCQLLKQVNNNPREQSRARGLMLLGLFLAHFHPPPAVENFVEALLIQQAADGVRRVLHHKIIQGANKEVKVSLRQVMEVWEVATEERLLGVVGF